MKVVVLCNVNDISFLTEQVIEIEGLEEIVYADDIYSKLPSRLSIENVEYKIFSTDWKDISFPDSIIREGKYGKYDAKAAWRRTKSMISYCDKALVIWDGRDERLEAFIKQAEAAGKECEVILHPDYREVFKYKLYVDLDGVLADFEKGVESMHGKPISEISKRDIWSGIRSYRKEGKLFFYDLDVMPDAIELWNSIRFLNPTILTSTGGVQHRFNGLQKELWVCNKFGNNVQVITTRSSNMKALYADENSILIDDREKSIDPWIEAGGIGILHKNAEETIKTLKEYGL